MYLYPGFGDFLGVIFGQMVLCIIILTMLAFSTSEGSHVSSLCKTDIINQFLWATVRVACSSFWSGLVWQANVNLANQYNLNFTETFVVVWIMSGLTFFMAYALHGCVIRNYLNTEHHYSVVDILHDAEISMGVGCSAACFVGTSVRKEFDNNWLTPLFGEPDEESSPFISMLAAGASTVFGFCLCQILVCCFICRKHSWTDHH